MLVYLRVLLCFWRIQRIQQQNNHPKIFHSKIFHEVSAAWFGLNLLAQLMCSKVTFSVQTSKQHWNNRYYDITVCTSRHCFLSHYQITTRDVPWICWVRTDFYHSPWKINGWNLKITCLKSKIIDLNQTFIFEFHVNFQGCTEIDVLHNSGYCGKVFISKTSQTWRC